MQRVLRGDLVANTATMIVPRGLWLGGIVTLSLAVGMALAHESRLAVLALIPLVASIGYVRFGQCVLFLLLVAGATTPLGHIYGLNPVFILAWTAAALLSSVRSSSNARSWLDGMLVPLLIYGFTLLLVGGFDRNTPGALAHAFELINYIGTGILGLQLARRGSKAVAQPVIAALIVHDAIACFELLRGQTLFYSLWKIAVATKYDGVLRVASTVADPNYFALTLLILAGIVWHARSSTSHPSLIRWLVGFSLGIGIFTFSRAGGLGLVIAILVAMLRTYRGKRVVMVVSTLTMAALLLTGTAVFAPRTFEAVTTRFTPSSTSDASIQQREVLQEYGLRLAEVHWLVGIGPGVFEERASVLFNQSQPLNVQRDVLDTYLQVLLDGGIGALAAWLLLFMLPTVSLVKRRESLGYLLAGVAVAVATLDALTLLPLWLVLGIAWHQRADGLNSSDS